MSDNKTKSDIMSQMEIDTVSEVMNISMGSADTAMSTLLDNKVLITSPNTNFYDYDVVQKQNFHTSSMVAIEVKYMEGISGSIILAFKKEDIRLILSQMLMAEISQDFEIDEMAEGAICELINQMVGASASVLSCFLGVSVIIDTPKLIKTKDLEQDYFSKDLLNISFDLNVVDILESTLICIMPIDLAKQIVDISLSFDNADNVDNAKDNFLNNSMNPLPENDTDDLLKSLFITDDIYNDVDVKEDSQEQIIPKRFTKEQLRAISSVYENYSSVLSFYFSSILRCFVEIECVHIEEQRYSEFNNTLPDYIIMGIGEIRFTDINEKNSVVLIDISKPIAFSIIDQLTEKYENDIDYKRKFTNAKMSIMENIFRGMFSLMSDAWFDYLEFDAIYRELETKSRSMNVIAPDETIVVIILDITINDYQGTICVCIPVKAFEKIKSQNVRKVRRINNANDPYHTQNL